MCVFVYKFKKKISRKDQNTAFMMPTKHKFKQNAVPLHNS